MNTNTARVTTRARRAATLSAAGLFAVLALAPTGAHASQSTSDGGGSTAASTGDTWSYMYDSAQRKEAMARVQDEYDASADTSTGSQYVNAWDYMYQPDQHRAHAVRHQFPGATSDLP